MKQRHNKQQVIIGTKYSAATLIFQCLLFVLLILFLGIVSLSYDQLYKQYYSKNPITKSEMSLTATTTTAIPVSAVSIVKSVEKLKTSLRTRRPGVKVANKIVQSENNHNYFFVNMTVNSENTVGTVILKVHYDWAPLGAKRFRELIEESFYDNAKFFRVIKRFMAQVGIHADPAVTNKWQGKSIPDDPIGVMSNKRGTFSFATSGPNTRGSQIFFNFVNNAYLDKEGFTPVGEVVQGLQYIDGLYAGYGEGGKGDGSDGRGPNQNRINRQGNQYLDEVFPKLSYIVQARILDEANLTQR